VRIAAVRPGSADIVLEVFKGAKDVWQALGDNVNQITAWHHPRRCVLGNLSDCRRDQGEATRKEAAVYGADYRNKYGRHSNIENVYLEMTLEIYELFKAGTVDPDLDKMTSPLVSGRIDAAELEARAADGTVLRDGSSPASAHTLRRNRPSLRARARRGFLRN
jgi:hypothetical protein